MRKLTRRGASPSPSRSEGAGREAGENGKPVKIRRCARNCKRRAAPPQGRDPAATREARRPASAVVRIRPGPACGAGTRGLFGLHVPPRRHVDVVRRRDEMNALLLIAAIAAPTQNDRSDDTIVATAAREPEPRAEAPASATIFDRATLDALGLPMTADILRL